MKRPFRATIPLTQTLIALPAIWAALPAAGQSTWNGGATSDWSADINWSPAPPESGDDAIIADTTTGNLLVLDDGSRTIGSLTFGGSGTRATTAFNIRTGNNTLTIQNGVVANGNFTTGNVFNVGGKITIAANQVWAVGGDLGAVNTDKGVVISNGTGIGELTMTGDLTKTGSGQLSLVATTVSGAGNFVVNEGALKLNAGSSSLLTVGGPGNITVNNNASLFVSRNSGTLSLTRNIVLNNSGNLVLGGGGVANATTIASNITWNGTHVLELQNSGNSFVSTGAWSGSGSVTKTGPGTIHLAGDYSEHTGSFTISSGRVRLGNGGTEGFLGSGAFTNNGIFEFNRSDDFTFLKNISGTGSVEKSLSNTVILAGENTYGGYTYIRGGSLQIGEGATLSSSTSVVLTGAGSTFDVNGQTLTVAALHSGSSSDTTTNVHLGTNGKLTVTGNAAVSGITNTASNYYGIISGSGDIDYNNASNPQGIWTLQNAGNSFTGDVTITSGRLRLNPNNTGSDGALGDWSNRLIFNGTPVESFVNGEGTASIQQSVAQDITIESSRDVVINDGKEGTFYVWGSRTMTVDAGIEGGGTLRKEDGGTLVLTAANSYEGGTKLVAGIIRAENNGAFGTGDVVIGSTSNGYNNRVELSGVTIANDFTVNTTGNTGFLGAITATGNALSVINGDVTISANVGNGGHLASVDDAVLRINGAINVVGNIIPNARTGTVEVAGGGNYTQFNVGQGTLRLGADNGLNSAAHLSLGLSNPATFDLNGYDQTLAQLTRAASSSTTVTNNGTTASTLTINSTVDHTYSGVLIDGTGGFSVSKSGSGSFALSGDNAGFTGDLTVTGGTVQINGAFGGSVIVQGGTLSGTNTISGPVAIHSGTLAPGNSPGTLSITNALELSANSLLSWELNALDTTVGLGINDLVTGITNLTLDGILSVTGTGDFTTVAEGTAWRLFEYSGSLDDRTLEFGSMPALAAGLQWTIDTSSFGQINLVVGSVPEPSVLLLGALGGCFLLRRRR